MKPIDVLLMTAGTAAIFRVINFAKEIRKIQGLKNAERNVEMLVEKIRQKIHSLQARIDREHPEGMTDDQARTFYMNRRTEFAELAGELQGISGMAASGNRACEKVIEIAKERARHWKLTLFLSDYCPVM